MSSVPTAGQQFGSYRLENVLGRGGMGVVYRAEHVHLGRVVALKVLAPGLSENSDFRTRFLREARMAAALDHPNVVTVYDAGDVDGSLYLAMRFVPGEDLSAVLQRRGALPAGEALTRLGQVASALDAAHVAGLVHRDVKPGNVLVEGERCYLMDFGLTKHTQAGMTAGMTATAMTATGVFLGTPDYAAPEQISASRVDGRADVYALGGMLYECLTGSRPFPRDQQVAVLYAQLHEPPPKPSETRPGLPPALDEVIGRALAKAPSQRYATCGELIAAAREALAQHPAASDQRPTAARPVTQATAELPLTEEPAPAAPRTPVTPPPLASVTPTPATPPRGPAAPPDYHRHTRRRSRWPLAAAVLAAAALVIAIAVASGGGGDGDGGGGASPTKAGSARVAGDPIAVGKRPFGVALTGGKLWVANNSSDTVTSVSPAGGGATDLRISGRPFGLAATADAVWAVQTDYDSVARIDASTGRTEGTIAVGDEPYFAAADGDSVYVSSGGDGTVTVIDAASGRPRGAPIRVGGALRGIAAEGGVVWVADKDAGAVKRIADGRVDRTVRVGRNPVQVAIGGGAVWVANKESDSVSRVDPDSGAVRTTRVGDEPFGIAYGEGYVWVTTGGDDYVWRLDPQTGRRSGRRVRVPGQPTGVTVADGSVWVTANDAGTVTRIEPTS